MKIYFFIISLICTLNIKGVAQWTLQSSGSSQTLNEIFFPAVDTGYVAGEDGTLLRTFNGGEHWVSIDLATTKNLNDLFFLDARTGFVVGDSGYFAQTLDAGETWTKQYLTNIDRVDLSAVYFTSLLVGYAGGRENVNNGIIFKTIDGGITWEVTHTPATFLDVDFKRIIFPVPDTGYAITRGMCMKTVDAGDNWFITDTALVESGGMFSILEDAFFFSADTGYIVGWYNGFSGYTVDGGRSWVDQFISNNQWYSIDFPSRQTGYLVGWSQLMKTSDGGETWVDISSPVIQNSGIYSIHFTDDDTGYACGNGGLILKTTAGGTTGMNDVELDNRLSVYPNPSDGIVFIQLEEQVQQTWEKMEVEVYDSFGKNVLRSGKADQKDEIDLTGQPGGIYFLRLYMDKKAYAAKVFIR